MTLAEAVGPSLLAILETCSELKSAVRFLSRWYAS